MKFKLKNQNWLRAKNLKLKTSKNINAVDISTSGYCIDILSWQ